MEKRFKGMRIFVIIAISLFILALPAYLRCTRLSQIKFVSSDLGFENPVQEEGMPDPQKELKVYGRMILLIIFLLGANLFELCFHLFSQTVSFHQRIVVLRC